MWARYVNSFISQAFSRSKTAWQIVQRLYRVSASNTKDQYSRLKSNIRQDTYRRQLKKRPWYIVLGAPNSGKKSLLANSGIQFQSPEQCGREAISLIKQFPDYDWWFSNKAVFVDIATYNEELERVLQKKFIRYLRKQRKSKPLSGIVLTFSVIDIMMASHKNRQAFLSDITAKIRELHSLLKTQLPIYVMLTKCDQISGFNEFFSDLSKEELAQVWGITLPIDSCDELSSAVAIVNTQFSQLILRLQQRVLWSMDGEKNQRGRHAIFNFPQQMQLLKKPISIFISELFGATRYINALQLRGIYFTSALQGGPINNFLEAAVGTHYQLQGEAGSSSATQHENYFLHRLFHEVLFLEGDFLGFSDRAKRIKKWLYRFSCIAAPLLILGGFYGFYNAYYNSKKNIVTIHRQLDDYHRSTAALSPNDTCIKNTLPALNALSRSKNAYKDTSLLSWLIYANHRTNNAIEAALQRSIHTLFLPRIAAFLENKLNNNNYNANTLYAILKGYLAFSPSDYTEPSAIIAPMEYSWSHIDYKKPKLQGELKYYLNLGAQSRLDELPLDRPLINKVRLKLQEIVPAQRAYGLLTFKAIASDTPDIDFASTIGADFNAVFDSSQQKHPIPALYTATGYQQIYLKQYHSIAKQVAEDNREIGLDGNNQTSQSSNRIESQMQHHYSQRYIQQWRNTLSNITIKPFTNLQSTVRSLSLINSEQSPLFKLLDMVYDNTFPISDDTLHVKQAFNALNKFSESSLGSNTYHHVKNTLIQLQAYLHQLTQTPDPDKAEYLAAQAYMQGKSNPIRTLTQEAQQAPTPIKRWLQSIADQSWDIVEQGAMRTINSAWNTQVIPEYQQQIHGKFPITRSSRSDISIDDFTHFFGNGGTLTSFFNTYLKNFINTTKKQWVPDQLDGHSLNLSKQDITLFRRTQFIRTLYFANGSKVPNLQFTLQARLLSGSARDIELQIGSHNMYYAHGPQNLINIHWPFPTSNQNTTIIISSFDGSRYAKNYVGPWSLFRLMNTNSMRQAGAINHYWLNIDLHQYNASYLIRSSAPLNTFRLTSLMNLHINNTL